MVASGKGNQWIRSDLLIYKQVNQIEIYRVNCTAYKLNCSSIKLLKIYKIKEQRRKGEKKKRERMEKESGCPELPGEISVSCLHPGVPV